MLIRRRVYEQAGEDPGGAFYRCEGEAGCTRWKNAAGTYDEKLETVIPGCDKKCSPPPREEDRAARSGDAAVRDLVDNTAQLIAWENAGIETDWAEYSFEQQKLFVIWREAEREVEALHKMRVQAWIKAQFTTDTDK